MNPDSYLQKESEKKWLPLFIFYIIIKAELFVHLTGWLLDYCAGGLDTDETLSWWGNSWSG